MTGTSGPRTRRVRGLIADAGPALNEVPSAALTEAGRRPCPVPESADAVTRELESARGRRAFAAGVDADGRSAPRAARGPASHAVALDGPLPDLDGLQVLRRPRFEDLKPPVRMLTARHALDHRLDGPETGADNRVTQHFSLQEAVRRLHGLLRRAGSGHGRTGDSVHVLGDLAMAEDTREVRWTGVPVRLAAKELDLLSLLLGDGHLVEVHISGPRRKIDKGRAPLIHTVRGLDSAIRPAEDGR
ncbi:response regulator transcription factor [Streptomyces sp. NPDC005402]|uniref:response regulator transcription factor n=1 Tax=Streptomyces sp. NPDC005402 TaxID=3155338 RepID=UPI0033B39DBB